MLPTAVAPRVLTRLQPARFVKVRVWEVGLLGTGVTGTDGGTGSLLPPNKVEREPRAGRPSGQGASALTPVSKQASKQARERERERERENKESSIPCS